MEREKGRRSEGRKANKGGKKVRKQVKEKGPKNEIKRKIKTLKEDRKEKNTKRFLQMPEVCKTLPLFKLCTENYTTYYTK